MEKIKSFLESRQGKDIFIIMIIVLVGLSSFELGRLSKNTSNSGIKIEYPKKEDTQTANILNSMPNLSSNSLNSGVSSKKEVKTEGSYFASKIGHKYYSISCSAGKNIKLENRIYFSTKTEAEKAGYALSSSCR